MRQVCVMHSRVLYSRRYEMAWYLCIPGLGKLQPIK